MSSLFYLHQEISQDSGIAFIFVFDASWFLFTWAVPEHWAVWRSVFPYKAVFHVLPLKHSNSPELWSCFYMEGWLEVFGRFLHLHLKTCPRICLTCSSGKEERSFLVSWCRKTYWQLLMVGMSLAAGSGEKRWREIYAMTPSPSLHCSGL